MRLTIPVLRDLTMLGIGSTGMIHELLFVPTPSPLRIGASMLCLLGPAAVQAYWLRQRSANGSTASLPAPPASDSSSSS